VKLREAQAKIEEALTKYPLTTDAVNRLSIIHIDVVRSTVELDTTIKEGVT
jgi:hypothetical protein